MGRAIAVFSRKGGVGKTITAVNLAAVFALMGHRTLLVDCDPQASAAVCSGRFTLRPDRSLAQAALKNRDPMDVLTESCLELLKVISFTGHPSTEELDRAFGPDNFTVLKDLIGKISSRFDYIFLDTSPDTSSVTINALCAADSVLVPLQSEYLAFNNLGQTIATLKDIKTNHAPEIVLLGVVLTMFETGTLVSHRILATAKKHIKDKLFETVIPRNGLLRDSPGYRKPLVVREPKSIGSESYMALAKEILSKQQT